VPATPIIAGFALIRVEADFGKISACVDVATNYRGDHLGSSDAWVVSRVV